LQCAIASITRFTRDKSTVKTPISWTVSPPMTSADAIPSNVLLNNFGL
jgi:hypothetical protein